MADVLLAEVTITHVLDCIADPTKIRVIAEFSDDVSPVMPYLNALIKNASYSHEAKILHFNVGHRMLTLYPRVVTMAKADDLEDAWRVLDWLKAQINEAHSRRDEVEPCYDMRPALRPLDVYVLLPRENCRRCGEATCMAFAFKLLQGRAAVDGCSLLAEERFVGHRQALSTMLGGVAIDSVDRGAVGG